MRADRSRGYLLPALLAPALALVAVALLFALLTEPRYPGLAEAVSRALPDSGTGSPVTAVLLDFRGYDTLLEMTVLTAALAGAWSVAEAGRAAATGSSPVLLGLIRVLGPLFPIICGYLLWAGSGGPGGAFQAGSVLATFAVLLALAVPRRRALLPERPLRITAVAGTAVFLTVGLGVMAYGGRFLDYPAALAGSLMLLIEAVAMISIAAILAGLFIGGPPGPRP
jgi:multisubunit Na+/H+ antiporter MnhB subunit